MKSEELNKKAEDIAKSILELDFELRHILYNQIAFYMRKHTNPYTASLFTKIAQMDIDGVNE